MTNNLIPAEFLGMHLDIVDHDGRRWLTAKQIGLALGFDESNARNGIIRLHERHGDEFTERDTCVVNLTTQGVGDTWQKRATRIFSESGCNKLGFFAQTPRAKEFRTWAARALAAPEQAALPTPSPGRDLELAREVGALKDEMLRLYRRLDTAQRGQIRALTGQARLMAELGVIKDAKIAAIKYVPPEEVNAVVVQLDAEGFSRKEIAVRTGRTTNHIRQILFKHRHAEPQGELALEGGAQ